MDSVEPIVQNKHPSAFTVSGRIPLQDVIVGPDGKAAPGSNGKRDTHDNPPANRRTVCDPDTHRSARSAGDLAAKFMDSVEVPEAARLLRHFLDGSGTPIDFPDGSPISNDLRKNAEFQKLDQAVQAEVKRQLDQGVSTITLAAPTLRLPVLADPPELYWCFRGTQGLDVDGDGKLDGSTYVGTLKYTIRGSYGFAEYNVLLGVGTLMRYLQVNCGNTPTGAHWFPDSITAAVPFSIPAG